jgi:hypothetical protein
MRDLEDCDLVPPVIDKVNDSVLSLSHPVAIGVAGKLLGADGSRLNGQLPNSPDDALTI